MQSISLLTMCQVFQVPYFISSSLQLYNVRGNHSNPAQSTSDYSFMIPILKMGRLMYSDLISLVGGGVGH